MSPSEFLATSLRYRAVSEKEILDKKFEIYQPAEVQLGDIVVHDGWTLHVSTKNVTGESRRVLTVSYFNDKALVNSHGRAAIADDINVWTRWMSQVSRGGPANSSLTPCIK